MAGSFYLTALAMVKVMAKYIALTIFPYHLTLNHQIPNGIPALAYIDYKEQVYLSQKITDLSFLFSATVVVGTMATAIFLYKRLPIVTFCIFWFFASLTIVSNIIPLNNFMSERYLYLASYGWSLLVAYLVVEFWQGFKSENCEVFLRKRKLKILGSAVKLSTVLLFVAILVFYSVRTYQRNGDWRDN